ncbi:hypothetical protein FB451DRAFT_1412515 [Mycena latifolia]|nr:hypothetical protein FB451DRAFT_1412515 [Mycena latifolia]
MPLSSVPPPDPDPTDTRPRLALVSPPPYLPYPWILVVSSPCRRHIGLPTVPVFTGVTGAVNGTPSRPVEPLVDEICGTAVDGR